MRQLCFCAFLVCANCSQWVARSAEVTVSRDGSITGRFPGVAPNGETVVLRFGLPRVAPQKTWDENSLALHSVWVTNGIRYEQTVFSGLIPAGQGGASKSILLANIAGENTNADYAEATAEITVEIAGKGQKLELAEGLVWCSTAGHRLLLGALDIPASGVKTTEGEVLCFGGNMPPSEKGSMTLKIPLDCCPAEIPVDELRDLVFAEELRRCLKRDKAASGSPSSVRLRFDAPGAGRAGAPPARSSPR